MEKAQPPVSPVTGLPTGYAGVLDELKPSIRVAQLKAAARVPQPVRELDGRNLTQPVSERLWGHNVIFFEEAKDAAVAANLKGTKYGG